MSRTAIKGWCPSAHRPMPSGDGLVVRVRPRLSRLSPGQALGVADLATRYGNGLIDLTGRANLQIRGLNEDDHAPLFAALAQLDLVDLDAGTESERNILLTPFWSEGDDTHLIAVELERALGEGARGLPAKFGFAVDCGKARLLAQAPADVRIERGSGGEVIVRADGSSHGRSVNARDAVSLALALADWFVKSGGTRGQSRMAGHIAGGASLPRSLAGEVAPARALRLPSPGIDARGALVGLAFGQMQSAALTCLARSASSLRMTPWRMILLEGLTEMPRHDGLVTCGEDPLLRVSACTGAPACKAAYAETRALGAALAPFVPARTELHVSGCDKGCAHPAPAATTLIATADGFDLVRDGATRDAPVRRGLTRASILADPCAVLEAG